MSANDGNVPSNIGTYEYNAPELRDLEDEFLPHHIELEKIDVYNLGLCLYYLLARKKKTLAENDLRQLLLLEEGWELMMQMMCLNPSGRPSIDEVLDDHWFTNI